MLDLATRAASSLQIEQNAHDVLTFASHLLTAPYTAVILARPESGTQWQVISNRAEPAGSIPASWTINLSNWPAFQQALDEREAIELRPTGLGARQLRLWYEEMGLSLWGAMLVLPLQVQNRNLGLLLLGAADNRQAWAADEKATANALARYVAQVLHNSFVFAQAADRIADTPPVIVPAVVQAPPPTPVSGRLIAVEEERDRLKTDLETANVRLAQAETQAAKATKQAYDLAATLQELENVSYDERVASLEKEIETLRESLIEAEEAMALAAAGEGGLSTEWIMTTITRYSGQLEAAQARIQTLEADLLRRERGVTDELVVSLAQELRTPMTSIAGYTDLLLSEMLGGLGAKQRDFLQRVKANVERMDAFLDLIVQLTTSSEQLTLANGEGVEMRSVMETAVATVITQVREKKLRVDLDVDPDLPPLNLNRDAIQKILNNLVGNACQASKANSRVVVSAYVNALNPPVANGHNEPIRFIHLAVTDSGGGIPVADRARVFAPQHRADHPLITGLGDTGAGLAVARTLAEANGGRVWIESKMGVGSTLSVLFPIAAEAQPAANNR